MADLSKIVDNLSALTVMEAAELAKMLEEAGLIEQRELPRSPHEGRLRRGDRNRAPAALAPGRGADVLVETMPADHGGSRCSVVSLFFNRR